MSTKTTFKRVALVAVAALGAGVLSVAPANAATTAITTSVPTVGTAESNVVLEQNILRGVSKLGWENAPLKAETRPPREREPGFGLELTPKS